MIFINIKHFLFRRNLGAKFFVAVCSCTPTNIFDDITEKHLQKGLDVDRHFTINERTEKCKNVKITKKNAK